MIPSSHIVGETPGRLRLATTALTVSAAIYGVLGLALVVLVAITGLPTFSDPGEKGVLLGTGAVWVLFCLALAVLASGVAWGLRRRQTWAWIAGLCLFAIYVPSLFLPLGVMGLWGLLDPSTRAQFGMAVAGSTTVAPGQPGVASGSAVTVTRGPACLLWVALAAVVLVVVLGIAGLVAAIVVPNFLEALERTRELQGGGSSSYTTPARPDD
ncbi:MAG TPA: hypothetical protein VNB06_07640 [Thermoanaerobaculia bacterium]|nr:hypothetical protein [Thermoanaerobaculia bacterium]